MLFLKDLNIFHIDGKEIPCITASGAPDSRFPGAPGSLYMDSITGHLYVCTDADTLQQTYSWRIVGDVDSAAVRQAVTDYLARNPISDILSSEEKHMLLTLFRGAVYQSELAEETAAAYSVLQNLWGAESKPENNPDAALTSISAVYSGGDVAVGTAVADLPGLVVTAHYSDGTSEAVTGYTLSGTIAEGSNTVTVSYGGKATTFTVTGVAESDGETVVGMTRHPQGFAWYSATEYSDGGETEFTGAPSNTGTMVYSDVFAKDTTVNIAVLYGATNAALKQYAGCIPGSEEMNTGSSRFRGPAHYVEQIGNASTNEYTAQYTVRAGYRLAVINYNGGIWQSLAVTM